MGVHFKARICTIPKFELISVDVIVKMKDCY